MQQLRQIEQSAQQLHTQSVPKPKFAFKRNVPPSSAPTPSASETKQHPPEPVASVSTMLTDSSVQSTIALDSSIPPVMSETDIAICKQTQRYLGLPSAPGEGGSEISVTIADIDRCVVNLLPLSSSSSPAHPSHPRLSAVHLLNATNSIILLPVLSGSLMVHGATYCTLVVGCHQVSKYACRRLSDSDGLVFRCSSECTTRRKSTFTCPSLPIRSSSIRVEYGFPVIRFNSLARILDMESSWCKTSLMFEPHHRPIGLFFPTPIPFRTIAGVRLR
jgi:hypothetical protein